MVYNGITGGELMIHNIPDTLGMTVKSARKKADMTIEELAERIDVTERYLYRIENEGCIFRPNRHTCTEI